MNILKYRPEIDGLRALAVFTVIMYHSGIHVFSGGFIGVDIFFVISGYLITSIIISDLEKKQFILKNFYERRMRRIFPALLLVMIVTIPFAWNYMLPDQLLSFSHSLIAASFFIANILFWQDRGYFATESEEIPLIHTWSLSVEEQFYIFFPLFLIIFFRLGKVKLFIIISALIFLGLLIGEWGWRNKPHAFFYLAPFRAWELLFGSISALIISKYGIRKNNLLCLLGLILVLTSFFIFDKKTPFPSIYTMIPILGVFLIIIFADTNTIVAKILSNKILVHFGLLSYSAYLWHQPIFAFLKIKFVTALSIFEVIIVFIITVILSHFSWKFVEKPFRNKNIISS